MLHVYLYVLSLCLVIENVGNLLREDLLSPGTSVDADHGHSNGPRGVANSHGQIGIISLYRA